MKNMRKKSVAVLIGLAVTGLVGASAASLGGIESDDLGADVGVVGSCDSTGVDVAFTTAVDAGVIEVRQVNVTDVESPACDGQDFTVELLDASDASLGSRAGVVPAGGDFTTNFVSQDVDANAVVGIAITISGTPAP